MATGVESSGESAARQSLRPLLAAGLDLAGLCAYLLFAPLAAKLIAVPSLASALVILAAYLLLSYSLARCLFAARVVLRRQLLHGTALSNILLFCAFGYSFFVIFMLLDCAGQFQSGSLLISFDLNSTAAAWLSLAGGIALLGLLVCFPAAILSQSPHTEARPRSLLWSLLLQLSSMFSMQFSGLYLAQNLGGEGEGLSSGGRVLIWLCVFILLLLFAAAPRLLLARLSGGWLPLASAVLSLAVYAWGVV